MNRIRLLPEQVANQIAAGEVVERPASVVKELVENAVDAEARRVTVEIQAGGRSLIRVTDDGVGMNRDDALLCLERHATSKIRTAHDLESIATMGFRGEAVPSIASVSRMTLTTRERDGDAVAGTRLVVHGGKIVEVKEAGAAPGTCLEVRQLFFNLPARRKFLRTEETEKAHVQHYLTLAALAYPEVSFVFIQNGRTVWQLPEAGGATHSERLRERLRGLYGSGLKLLPLDYSGTLPSARHPAPLQEDDASNVSPEAAGRLRIWGFIGAPGVSRSNRDEQHLFVNRRPIENRGLNYALLEGYHTALMKGRFPVCCLFLEIDPAAVDVNIHPAKREVKFRQEREVRREVTEAIRSRLLEFHGAGASAQRVPAPSPHSPSDQAAPSFSSPSASAGSDAEMTNEGIPGPSSHARPRPASDADSDRPPTDLPPPLEQSELPRAPQSQEESRSAAESTRPSTPEAPTANVRDPLPSAPTPANASQPEPLLSVPLRLVGVVGKLYVVLESDQGLVLLDQHAAHERVLFEEMLRRVEQGDAPSQRLLLPETLELSNREAAFVKEQLHALTRLGVGLSEFGERTFLLDAIPPFVRAAEAKPFVSRLIDELKAGGDSINAWRLGEDVVAKTVCRHAVKAHDPLSFRELERLIEDLRRCAMPYTCPHGRPTLIEMNFRELEKKFGRVQ